MFRHLALVMVTLWSAGTAGLLAQTYRASKPENDPTLVAMQKLASGVISEVHVPGYPPFPVFGVSLDAGTAISYWDTRGAHEARCRDLPEPMEGIWKRWAAYTTDEASGELLFNDMYHRYFLVHELGHLIAFHVIEGLPSAERKSIETKLYANRWESEMIANRIAVAWFREHDPQYLAKLVNDFRRIQAHLPSPVPAGTDAKTYYARRYVRLGRDPMANGWYQLHMVSMVYDEPVQSFQQVMDELPKIDYSAK